MDFVTRLPRSKDWRRVKYNSILVIVDQLINKVNYEPVITTLNVKQLVEVLFEVVIKYHGLLDFIITNQEFLFTLKFWLSPCYYFNVKRRLSTGFYPQTNGQTKDKTVQ